MNKKSMLSYIIFAIIFCLSICTINVMAVSDDDNYVVTEAPPVVTQAPTAAPVYTNPPTAANVYTNPPTKSYVAPATKKSTSSYVAPATKKSTSSYVAPATSAYRATSAAKSTTSADNKKSEIYDVDDEDVDVDTLQKDDWKDIEELLKDANQNDDSDIDDFNFIKNNDGKSDNGEWILYLGIGFEVIAVGIIVTLIILAVRRKKKVNNARHRNLPSGTDKIPEQRESQRPVSNRQISSHQQSRQIKKRSKYDTDEVYISKKKDSQNNRYKPKH